MRLISIDLNESNVRHVEEVLQNFIGGRKLSTAIKQASRRAAVTARKAGAQEIRNTYTIKAGDLKSATSFSTEAFGTTLHIKGPEEPVTKYKASRRRKGIFVSIKKGSGSIVPRSFDMPGRGFVAREGQPRYPVTGLFGPAVPQLYGNPAVVVRMTDEGMETYEKRLMHELERLAGG